MFAALAKPEPKASKKKKVAQAEEGGPGGNTAGNHVAMGKGFKVVERKPQKQKERAPKPAPGPTSTTPWGQKTQTPKPKPQGGVIGAVVMDPKQVKAEERAARALQNKLAQQKVVAEKGADIVDRKIRVSKKKEEEPTPAAAYAVVSAPAAAEKPARRAQAPVHADPNSWGAVAQPQPVPKKATQSQVKKTVGKSLAKVPVGAPQTEIVHERAADGSAIASVEYCFVMKGKALSLCAHEHIHRNVTEPQQVAQFLVTGGKLKGGFFIASEGKFFSEAKTVDECWMANTWFKALTRVLSDEATEEVVYPCWAAKDTESRIVVRKSSPTQLHLAYGNVPGTPPSQLKEVRVALLPFVTAILRETAVVVRFVNDVLECVRRDGNEEAVAKAAQQLPDVAKWEAGAEALGDLV